MRDYRQIRRDAFARGCSKQQSIDIVQRAKEWDYCLAFKKCPKCGKDLQPKPKFGTTEKTDWWCPCGFVPEPWESEIIP